MFLDLFISINIFRLDVSLKNKCNTFVVSSSVSRVWEIIHAFQIN